jgi:hypothetical protein
MNRNFISSCQVAQAASALSRPETDTIHAREELRKLVRQHNRQWGPVGFKVSIHPNEDGRREYQLYCWDWQRSREVLLSGGVVSGSIEHVQSIARREAAAIESRNEK